MLTPRAFQAAQQHRSACDEATHHDVLLAGLDPLLMRPVTACNARSIPVRHLAAATLCRKHAQTRVRFIDIHPHMRPARVSPAPCLRATRTCTNDPVCTRSSSSLPRAAHSDAVLTKRASVAGAARSCEPPIHARCEGATELPPGCSLTSPHDSAHTRRTRPANVRTIPLARWTSEEAETARGRI